MGAHISVGQLEYSLTGRRNGQLRPANADFLVRVWQSALSFQAAPATPPLEPENR